MTSDKPQSSAEMCLAAADLINTLASSLLTLTAVTPTGLLDDETRSVIFEIAKESSPRAQDDLRVLASWFEKRPYSNRDAWAATPSYKSSLSEEEE